MYSILPPSVANDLRHRRPVPARRFESVTVMFSGMVGFSQFCVRNSDSLGAINIVNFLNGCFTTFDRLFDARGNANVYKVKQFYIFTL